MLAHNFDVDTVIPSSKQKVKINADFIEVNQTKIACNDVVAVKYGVSLVGTVKKPKYKKYIIDVQGKDGKTASILFNSNQVGELLAEDHIYYYIMSGLWQYVKKHLVENFITALNAQETIAVGTAKFNYQGFSINYKTWFLGKTKTALVPWSEIKYFQNKGHLHIEGLGSYTKVAVLSFHNDWNAVVLNTLLHYLWQDHRKEKLAKGEKI
jgi:hypothetical protein